MAEKRRGLFTKVGKTRIIPIGYKILVIFIVLTLLSNFATNFIATQLSQRQIINLNNTIMVEQLKELYSNASNQFQIFSYMQNREDCIEALERGAESGFDNHNSVALAVRPDGTLAFVVSNNPDSAFTNFADVTVLDSLNQKFEAGISEGSVNFSTLDGEFFGVYKYHSDWDFYLIRAEKRSDLNENLYRNYLLISILILLLTAAFIIIGAVIIHKEFRSVREITKELYDMQRSKQLDLIDLSSSPNDDITYLAASFNSLSSSVNNLLGTFQKFVPKDVVAKAYTEQGITLEGSQQELTMLFSDIKSFTYRTETLGNDIIDVLNVHYNRVIHSVHQNNGVVGSIIGDAILAVYGTLHSEISKSHNAILAAWDITRVTAALRESMQRRRTELESKRALSESEERIFRAVLIDVGVGIDGGNVFYGNIGSNEHMANTVIGDNVNSASRLEGLTRIYHIPVIVSEYVKNEVEMETSRFSFYEIDTVQVKGKTEGKKIYFPLDVTSSEEGLASRYDEFELGLAAYYSGDWKLARKHFNACDLDVAQVFKERIGLRNAPEDWSGIWTMTTK